MGPLVHLLNYFDEEPYLNRGKKKMGPHINFLYSYCNLDKYERVYNLKLCVTLVTCQHRKHSFCLSSHKRACYIELLHISKSNFVIFLTAHACLDESPLGPLRTSVR